jgi:hypothetical protein
MFKKLLIIAGVLALSACASTQSKIDKIHAQLNANAAANASVPGRVSAKIDFNKANSTQGIIVVGRILGIEKFDKVAAKLKYSTKYVPGSQQWHPGQPPYISEAEFIQTISGYTSIETAGYAKLIAIRQAAYVPTAILSSIGAPSVRQSFLYGASGDIVVGRTNADGYILVEAVLCVKASDNFDTCVSQQPFGRFDPITGQELDRGLVPIKEGTFIDTVTYSLIKKTQ